MLWWHWISAALVLGILEVLAPGHIFLGFAAGAAVVGLLLLLGGPLAAWLASSFAVTVLVFAAFSLLFWIVLQRVLGARRGQVKVWDRDIND